MFFLVFLSLIFPHSHFTQSFYYFFFHSHPTPLVRLAYFVLGGRGRKKIVDVLYEYTSFKTTRGTATTSLDDTAPKIAKFIILITRRFSFVEVHLIIYAFNSLLPAATRRRTFWEFFIFQSRMGFITSSITSDCFHVSKIAFNSPYEIKVESAEISK